MSATFDKTGTVHLAIATLKLAVQDMKGESQLSDNPKKTDAENVRDLHARARATAWLASKQAVPYYDLVGLDQLVCLEGANWKRYAKMFLAARPEKRFPRDVRVVLREVLWTMC